MKRFAQISAGIALLYAIAPLLVSGFTLTQNRVPKFEFEFNRHKYLKDFADKVDKACTKWYPSIAKFLYSSGYEDPAKITIRFDPDYDGVAYAEPDKALIVGSTKYYREHQDDVGSMIHEMTHIIQKYPGNCPGWYVEGLADYTRYFQYEPKRKPGKPGRNQSYRDGYGVSAYFLNFVYEKVKGGKDAVLKANAACRTDKYSDKIWVDATNKNLDTLWNLMQETG